MAAPARRRPRPGPAALAEACRPAHGRAPPRRGPRHAGGHAATARPDGAELVIGVSATAGSPRAGVGTVVTVIGSTSASRSLRQGVPRVSSLFPALVSGSTARRPALRFGDRSLTYAELAASAGELAARLDGRERVAVWATPSLETAVGVVAALLAGVPAVPLNPKSGDGELGHILADSGPSL